MSSAMPPLFGKKKPSTIDAKEVKPEPFDFYEILGISRYAYGEYPINPATGEPEWPNVIRENCRLMQKKYHPSLHGFTQAAIDKYNRVSTPFWYSRNPRELEYAAMRRLRPIVKT
jgi:hypothetical protein